MRSPPDDSVAKICQVVMDDDTCMVCAAWHGVEFDRDDEVVILPNPHCTCPQGCRCTWVWVNAAEASP